MPSIRPFRAIRPVKDKAHLVVSRSYITYEPNALVQKLDSNPYSFIHVINPDHGRSDKAAPNSELLFERIKGRYHDFLDQGIFIMDVAPAIYLYEQVKPEGTFLGLICGTSAADYDQDRIKKHEHTISSREEMFSKYLDLTDINAEPVLLTYRDDDGIEAIKRRYLKREPIYDFSTTDRARHRLWSIDAPDDIHSLQQAFEEVGSFYIADGHHRSASSSRLAAKRKAEGGSESAQYFMSYLVPQSQMCIMEFNRLVKDLNGHQEADLLEALQEHFLIEQCDRERAKPRQKGEMAMYLAGKWYGMHLKSPRAEVLDADLCTDLILTPLLDIADLRSDRRVGFLGGHDGLGGLEREVNGGNYAMGIALYPVSTEELMAVADRGEVMPPKSTWVEPKLRSGLTIYSLTDS